MTNDAAMDKLLRLPLAQATLARAAVDTTNSYLRVTGVALDPAGYSGALPAALLSSLPFLASLSLADNRFHGELPTGVPLPLSLRILDLSGNAFSGAIVRLALRVSSINQNQTRAFSHPGVPVHRPSALQELYLSRNGFSAGVPSQLALLGALTRLELQHNALVGALLRLGVMRSLVHLGVSGNALSGSLLDVPRTLPPSIWPVAARNNSFSRPLSTAMLAALPVVRVLDLIGNVVSDVVLGAALAHLALRWRAYGGLTARRGLT
ncbi:leucine-rich repeat receptor-like protein FASCIATED EAR2 [Miscanthus floridulus]|uniref:leucine-rich repeat receptor-like protein FASCIATED EAR2 n=1 Tax=Miscanthus floridulus TaxID=154761 RepID=UPI00345A7780